MSYCGSLSWDSVVTQNFHRLLSHIFGQIGGRQHKSFMVRESGLSQKLY